MKQRRASVRAALGSVVGLALVGVFACSSSTVAGTAAPSADGGGATSDAASEATADASSSSCAGACTTTTLAADFGGQKRALVRGQFGTQAGDAGAELHLEAYAGGDPACPTQASPSPDYTLVLTGVPRGAAGRSLAQADGLSAAFLDFKGDLGLPPVTKATQLRVTVVAEDPSSPPAWVALDVSATFSQGTVVGHVYAGYCASLSL
jgi:hypothetical protein